MHRNFALGIVKLLIPLPILLDGEQVNEIRLAKAVRVESR
jgi:hypothetical protein